MPTNSEIFKRLMSNILLAEPITPKGKSALTELGIYMTEKEYLKKIYVDPFTLYQPKSRVISTQIIRRQGPQVFPETACLVP